MSGDRITVIKGAATGPTTAILEELWSREWVQTEELIAQVDRYVEPPQPPAVTHRVDFA